MPHGEYLKNSFPTRKIIHTKVAGRGIELTE